MYDPNNLFKKFEPESVNARSWIALVLSILALIALITGAEEVVTSPEQSFYAAPTDLEQVIAETKQSLVTLKCGDFLGSGWVIEIDWSILKNPDEIALIEEYPSAVITNEASASWIRDNNESAENPPKTTECIAPNLAQASIAIAASGIIGI